MGDATAIGPAATDGPSRVELAVLCALLFFLPLFEVPKQLLWLAWVIVWLAARGPRALFAPPRSALEWGICAVAASALAAGLFSGHWGGSIVEAGDPVRVVSVAWLIARGGYRPRQLVVALGAALAGTVAALVWAAFTLLRSDHPSYLELHSVGHVNHTAIYLAIALSTAVGLALAQWRGRRALSGALGACALLLCLALFVAASRAALGAATAFLVALAWAAPSGKAAAPARSRARWAFRVAIGAMLLGAALLYNVFQQVSTRPLQPAGEGVVERFKSRPEGAGMLSYRDGLWRVAAIGFASHPVFGVGNDRFGSLTAKTLCPADDGSGPPKRQADDSSAAADAAPAPGGQGARTLDPCDPTRLHFAPHAHSLYANALAERGAFGLLAVVVLLGAWAWLLAKAIDRCRGDDLLAGLWCASLGGWCVTALAGLLNTTLHHEHGMLAMLTLGALVSALGGARTTRSA